MSEKEYVQVIITPQIPFKGKYHHAGLFTLKEGVHPYDVYMTLVEALNDYVEDVDFEEN